MPADVRATEESVLVVADSATAAVGVAALLGGASGSSAPGQVMVIGGVRCVGIENDEEDLDVLMHPLGFRIGGVPAAGAIVGNMLLVVATGLLFVLLTRGLASLRFGRVGPGFHGQTPFVQASTLVRYPSVTMPIPLMLFPGTIQASFDLIFYPRGVLVADIMGWVGLAFCIGLTAFYWRLSPPPLAYTKTVEGAGRLRRYILGPDEWVGAEGQFFYMERHGVVFEIYRDLAYLKGKYYLLELLPIFPLAIVSSIRSSDMTVCSVKAALLALTMLLYTAYMIWGRIFLSPFVLHIMVAAFALMVLGLVGHAVAYAKGDMDHWGIRYGMSLFMLSMLACLVRALFDLVTLARDIYTACTTGGRRGADPGTKDDGAGALTFEEALNTVSERGLFDDEESNRSYTLDNKAFDNESPTGPTAEPTAAATAAAAGGGGGTDGVPSPPPSTPPVTPPMNTLLATAVSEQAVVSPRGLVPGPQSILRATSCDELAKLPRHTSVSNLGVAGAEAGGGGGGDSGRGALPQAAALRTTRSSLGRGFGSQRQVGGSGSGGQTPYNPLRGTARRDSLHEAGYATLRTTLRSPSPLTLVALSRPRRAQSIRTTASSTPASPSAPSEADPEHDASEVLLSC